MLICATNSCHLQDSENRPPRIAVPQWLKVLSGSLGGATEALCLNPLDVTKTRIQLDTVGKYNGVYKTATGIVKEEGVRALYKGRFLVLFGLHLQDNHTILTNYIYIIYYCYGLGLSPFVAHLTCKYALRMYTFGLFQQMLTFNGTSSMSPAKNFAVSTTLYP